VRGGMGGGMGGGRVGEVERRGRTVLLQGTEGRSSHGTPRRAIGGRESAPRWTSAGYRWPGTQIIGPPGNGNREPAPLR